MFLTKGFNNYIDIVTLEKYFNLLLILNYSYLSK